MLPDDNIAEALTSLAKLDRERGVLKRDIAAVDLRLLDRVTVRLRETASANPPGAAPQADVPTASTKVRRPKERRERTGFEGRGMGYTTTIRSKRQRIVTALDIGTSKICCLIAKTSPAPDWFEGKGDAVQFEVLGFDHTRAEGLKAGMIAHLDSAEACIRSAVDAAERMAGVTVEDVHVSVTCGRLKSESFSASVALPSGAVREDDIQRLLAGGRQYAGRDKRSVLHALPLSYRLDDEWRHQRAAGHVRRAARRRSPCRHRRRGGDAQLMLCVERCHLGVASLVAAPYASALSVITPDEAKLGVACIDFGAGTTTLSVLVDGHFIHADAIALGGNGITTDIARTLSAPARLRRAAQDAAWQRLCHAVRRARNHHLSRGHRHAAAEPEPDHQGAARRHHPPARRGDPRSDAAAAGRERVLPPRSPSIWC